VRRMPFVTLAGASVPDSRSPPTHPAALHPRTTGRLAYEASSSGSPGESPTHAGRTTSMYRRASSGPFGAWFAGFAQAGRTTNASVVQDLPIRGQPRPQHSRLFPDSSAARPHMATTPIIRARARVGAKVSRPTLADFEVVWRSPAVIARSASRPPRL